ncbi:MAG: hypothetical protein SchgKO_09840 [Schleiferiaceae bacterium]
MKGGTFWTAFCCTLPDGQSGTECRNGRRNMCIEAYECSSDDPGLQAEMNKHYSEDEIDVMIENDIPIDNDEFLKWLKENTNMPLI